MPAAPAARAAAPAPARPYFDSRWVAAHGSPDLGLHAAAGVVVDLDSRTVLWQLGGDVHRSPASLTKMMTAVVAVSHASLDRVVTVPAEAVAVEPDVMGLQAGERVDVRTLLYGLFLDSGNDAAETLARTLLPRDRFLAEMNARASAWGLRDTVYSNPTGLDDPGLHSSALDQATLAAHLAAEYPELMEIAGTRERSILAAAGHGPYDPFNLNKLLWTYAGTTGLKTGFTDDAGGCVVATATRDRRHLAAVVLGSDIFFTDAARLLDYGFATRAGPVPDRTPART